jgi:hypothetical protein
LSLSFSPPPLPLEIEECKHPKRNPRSSPPPISPLPTTNYHPLQNAATQINHHPQKTTQKNSTNKNKTCHNSQSLFLLVKNSWKTYKTTFRSEPKRKEGRKEGSRAQWHTASKTKRRDCRRGEKQNHEKGKGPNRRVCKMENKDDKKEDNKKYIQQQQQEDCVE